MPGFDKFLQVSWSVKFFSQYCVPPLKAYFFNISDKSYYWKYLKNIGEPENIELYMTISGYAIFFIVHDLFNEHIFKIEAKRIRDNVAPSQVFFEDFVKIF